MGVAASNASVIASCAPTIQVRRRPKRVDVIVSTTGPNAHLKAHGRYNEPTKAPIAAGSRPCRRIWVASSVPVKPSGIPSETYKRQKVARRRAFVASGSRQYDGIAAASG